jgi:hypothetical protein
MDTVEVHFSKIHPFLKEHSTLFSVLAKADEEKLTILRSKHIEDFSASSFKEFEILMHKLHYWDVDIFPREIYLFVHTRCYYCYEELFAIFDDSYTKELHAVLKIARDTSDYYGRSFKSAVQYKKFSALADAGCIGAFEYFMSIELDFVDYSSTYIYHAASRGHLKFIKYFHETKQLKLPEFVDMKILRKGHWQCYDYLYRHGSKIKIVSRMLDTHLDLSKLVSSYKYKHFDLDLLKYGCQTFIDHAGKELRHTGKSIIVSIEDYCEHFKVLKFYSDTIAKVTVTVPVSHDGDMVSSYDTHDVPYGLTREKIQFVHEQSKTCPCAHDPSCVHEHGFPSTAKFKKDLMLYVSSFGDFETFQYLRSIGYSSDICHAYHFIVHCRKDYLQSGIDDLLELDSDEAIIEVVRMLCQKHKIIDAFDIFKYVFDTFYSKTLDSDTLYSMLSCLTEPGIRRVGISVYLIEHKDKDAMLTCFAQHVNIAAYLIKQADEDVISSIDWTKLMVSAVSICHSVDFVKFILDGKFDLDTSAVQDEAFVKHHHTPVPTEIKKLLQSHGF